MHKRVLLREILLSFWLSLCAASGAVQPVGHLLNSPTNNCLTAVVYGGDRWTSGSPWVAVGRNGTVLFCQDGWRWKQVRLSSAEGDFLSVAYGNGLFVAGGNLGCLLWTSPDGTNWSAQATTSGTDSIDGLTFGAGRFVGVGSTGGSTYLSTSTNGTNWTFPKVPSMQPLKAVTYYGDYAPALFVAVGAAGTLITSSDGTNWFSRSSGTEQTLRAVSSAGHRNKYLAGGDRNTTVASNDGDLWYVAAPASFDIRGLASGYYIDPLSYSTHAVLAVGAYQSEGRIQASFDGSTWPGDAQSFLQPLYGIAQGPGVFVAVGDKGLIVTTAAGPAPLVNSWTKTADGFWEEPFWSLAELPAFWNAQVLFTNAGSKRLTLGPSATNCPSSLAIRALNVSAPDGSENLLALDHLGNETALDVTDTILIGTNGALSSCNSAIRAGSLEVRNRAVFSGEGSSWFRKLSVADVSSAELVLSNGLFSVEQTMILGGGGAYGVPQAPGLFTQYRGSNQVGVLGAASGGTYKLFDGRLDVGTDLRYGGVALDDSARLEISGGVVTASAIGLRGPGAQLLLSGGTLITGLLTVRNALFAQTNAIGSINNVDIGDPPAEFRLSSGSLMSRDFWCQGLMTQWGGVHTNARTLYAGGTGNTYRLLGGILNSATTLVWQVTFSQSGLSTNCVDFLKLWNRGRYILQAGALITSKTVVGDDTYKQGDFIMNGGEQRVGVLTLETGARYFFNDGVLSVTNLQMAPFSRLQLVKGTLDGNQSVSLARSSIHVAGIRQLGVLTLTNAGTSTIELDSTVPTRVEFQDSHAAGWDPSSRLEIWNWNGTPTGDNPADRILFGNSAQGLTASQLSRIMFLAPRPFGPGYFAAQMLPTGELVPVPPILDYTNSAQGLVLTWPRNFSLYRSTNVYGPYQVFRFDSPYTNPFGAPREFFYLRSQ